MAGEFSPTADSIESLEETLSHYPWFQTLRQKSAKLAELALVCKERRATQPIAMDITPVPEEAVSTVEKWIKLQAQKAFLHAGIIAPAVRFKRRDTASAETPRPVHNTAEMLAHGARDNGSVYEVEESPPLSADSHPGLSINKKGIEGQIRLEE